MKAWDLNVLNIGTRLTITFLVLLLLILGGNGFLIWQFRLAQRQTDRLSSVNQQSIAVLELEEYLLLFHQQMDELTRSRDPNRLIREAGQLREKLSDQIATTRNLLAHSASKASIDPAFLPTLDGIEITLPSQLDAITNLAKAGDWEAVHLRLGNELRPVETLTSALVNNIDQSVGQEHNRVAARMRNMQRRILFIVPATAIATFLCATLFGWAMARRIVELRLEERMNERTRIARELHDTLLQGIISVSMQLHIAEEKLPENSAARPLFMRSLQLIQQVIEDGRSALRGFRSLDSQPEDLERALSRLPQDFDRDGAADFRLVVEGSARVLRPLVRDEVYRIVREAIANAFRHSRATTIEVVVEYASRELRLSVRDNGCGIDSHVLERGRDGHFGLAGMRERAERIDARLRLLSSVANGTEVDLRVPGRIAFESGNVQKSSKSMSEL
jgi:signal transduction histidine kinase